MVTEDDDGGSAGSEGGASKWDAGDGFWASMSSCPFVDEQGARTGRVG